MSAIQLTTRTDSVAVLTFDQPGSKANVLTADLWTELETVLESLAARTDLRGLVLASAKPGIFIAGADLNLLANAPGPNDPAVRGFIKQGLRVLEKLEALPFPTCAAIDGAALGGGLEVALACDYRICGSNPKVRLGLPEVTLGLIPGWGGTQRLPRIIHGFYAAEMLWKGAAITGTQSLERNLAVGREASDVVAEAVRFTLNLIPTDWENQRRTKNLPVAELAPEVFGSSLPGWPTAVREVLRVLVEGASLPLKEAIAVETEAFMRLAGSDESKRLIGAFFASRKPK